jgi:hypothetical protein
VSDEKLRMYPESIQKAAEQDHRMSRNAPGLEGRHRAFSPQG